MSWWQKKLLRYGLRYGLSRTGLLEDEAIDLDNLDITIGKQNVIELKDVDLNLARISRLAQLPPCLRLETARVLLLRLTIPADFYQSSIVAEVDGVQIVARMEEDVEHVLKEQQQKGRSRPRSPISTGTPQHRKMSRRRPSPPLYDAGGLSEDENELHIPTTQEVAKSFLLDEPLKERRDIEALAATQQGLEQSFASEITESDDVGTGTDIGVPGFLTTFLQGIVDRFKLVLKNIQIMVETEVQGDARLSMPIAIRFTVDGAKLNNVDHTAGQVQRRSGKTRRADIEGISVDLLSKNEIIAALSTVPSRSSLSDDKSAIHSPQHSALPAVAATTIRSSKSVSPKERTSSVTAPVVSSDSGSHRSTNSLPDAATGPTFLSSRSQVPASSALTSSAGSDRFADARENAQSRDMHASDLDIQPGDDNISWASRRSKSIPSAENLWQSMSSEDDLPESLLFAEPERPSAPRAERSRSTSPSPVRQRRVLSPYDRSLHHPGTLPKPEESPRQQRTSLRSGSCPALDQSRHSSMELLVQNSASPAEHIVDDEQDALELVRQAEVSSASPEPAPETGDESLLQSQVFSHEQAQSMYMSAMSGSPRMDMPGGWNSEVRIKSASSAMLSELPALDATVADAGPDDVEGLDGVHASGGIASRNATPRAQSPMASSAPLKSALKVIEELLRIDSLTVICPVLDGDSPVPGTPTMPQPLTRPMKLASSERAMPGTFSAYAELSASRRSLTDSVRTDVANSVMSSSEQDLPRATRSSVDVLLGMVNVSLTWPSVQILQKLATKALLFSPAQKSDMDVNKKETGNALTLATFRLDGFSCRVRDHTSALNGLAGTGKVLLEMNCVEISSSMHADTSLRIGRFDVLVGAQPVFSLGQNHAEPVMPGDLASDSPAMSARVSRKRVTATKRPVTDISLEIAPVNLEIDLAVIKETFSVFGGLSGILELSSSFLSESGTHSPVATKPSKGVRFAGEPERVQGSELKLNARIGVVKATLRGSPCSVMLQTSTVKAIYREQGAVATIEHLTVSGPYSDEISPSPPLSVDLASVRIDYLLTPQDKDLERLLSLLTPSRDQYDDHGDILIDTLLRQRRKGSLLRVATGNLKAKVDSWECLGPLTALGDDLAKLSAVTKYLPEDDRPGLLTLLRIRDLEARLPINQRLGSLKLALRDLHLAHVGLPALLAFSVGAISACEPQAKEVLHPLVPLSGADDLPVVMARMLGGEMEPTVKVKLFNLCIEYSVPLITALTGMDEASPEELVHQLSQSVANMAMPEGRRKPSLSPSSDISNPEIKKVKISLLVHDSAIGLTPQKLPSKAIFVLNDAHLATTMPSGDIMSAKLELRKASIFVTDSSTGTTSDSAAHTSRATGSASPIRPTWFLFNEGYVSVGSIMSAVIDFRAKEQAEDESAKQIEVDVKNELFLLETCADSTQTLFATLGALAPPTPPSKVPKYLTQPMPIEDMMQSFSGDPYVQSEEPPETLFDVEQDPGLLSMSAIDDVEDMLADSEMTRSLYGPHSGVFGMGNENEDQSTIGDYPETAESLLEEDPFEMTAGPTNMHLGDAALMRDLNRQCKAAASNDSVDLGLYEVEDLDFDALGGSQQALGIAHRFNAPFAGRRGLVNKMQDGLPFRLRLRDFHLIWHLYDGYDWQRTRDGIVAAVEQVEQRAEERKIRRKYARTDPEDDESVIGDFLFNSIYIGVPADADAQELRRQINRGIDDHISETESIPVSGMSRPTAYSASGQPSSQRTRRRLKLGRSRSHKIAFELKGVSADVLVFGPNSGDVVSSVGLRLKDFEIFDNVPSSTWRKFLTHMNADPATREMYKPMIHIQIDNVKTLATHSATEMLIHVTVLPLRLHVDQDALDFITRFFEFKDPLMVDAADSSEKPFLQRIEVDTVDLCLDYKPKNVDYAGLRSGRTKEFMNFITLEGCNIRLKHAIIYGLRGFDLLHDTLSDIWTPDVTRNQLPKVLSGLAPVRNLANLGIGLRDVVAIPIREYKKDGRIVRSIQKGASHFGKITASELARLGAKVALGTQTMLSNAEELLAPASASDRPGMIRRGSSEQGWHDMASDDDEPQQRAVSAYANQPLGVLAGLKSARRHLEHDLLTARDALIAVQGEGLESSGPVGVAGAVARHAPTVILRPVIGTARAVGTTLLGVGNQIDRGNLRRVDDKYKRR